MELQRIVLVVAALTFCTGVCDGSRHMKKLIKDMFADYMSDVRPVVNESDTLTVDFGLALIDADIQEESDTLVSHVWMRYLWRDSELTWNPEDYGGISLFRIRPDLLWKPDVVLYNSLPPNVEILRDALAVVSSDGKVLWIPAARLTTHCPSPDSQEYHCMLKFGSWTYDGFKLDINPYDGAKTVDVSDYLVSNVWELGDTSFTKNDKYYPCCAEPYPDLTAILRFQKRHGH